MRQDAAQQHRIDAAAKANAAVDRDDGHAFIELFAQLGIGVDVDQRGFDAVIEQQLMGVVAQVTASAGVERD
jgi:hypothetical protein